MFLLYMYRLCTHAAVGMTSPDYCKNVSIATRLSIIILTVVMFVYVCTVITYTRYDSDSSDQPGKVANPARGQLNRENDFSLPWVAPENLVSRDGFGSPVLRQPAHIHTQAEYGAYSRDSSRFPRRRPFIY